MQPNAPESVIKRTRHDRKIGAVSLHHLDGRYRSTRRAKALARSWCAQMPNEVTEAQRIEIERAATLLVLSEDTRARRLGGDLSISLDDLVRLDRWSAQALRRLTGMRRAAMPRRQRSPLDSLPIPDADDGRDD
jgi:hypothetical protein